MKSIVKALHETLEVQDVPAGYVMDTYDMMSDIDFWNHIRVNIAPEFPELFFKKGRTQPMNGAMELQVIGPRDAVTRFSKFYYDED